MVAVAGVDELDACRAAVADADDEIAEEGDESPMLVMATVGSFPGLKRSREHAHPGSELPAGVVTNKTFNRTDVRLPHLQKACAV